MAFIQNRDSPKRPIEKSPKKFFICQFYGCVSCKKRTVRCSVCVALQSKDNIHPESCVRRKFIRGCPRKPKQIMRTFSLRSTPAKGLLFSLVICCFSISQSVLPPNTMSNIERNELKYVTRSHLTDFSVLFIYLYLFCESAR